MNKKMMIHTLMIAAIIAATFAAALFMSVNTYAKTSDRVTVSNIAKVDFETRSLKPVRMIEDNEVPLAEAPADNNLNMTLGWIVIAVAGVITGIIIYEDRRLKI